MDKHYTHTQGSASTTWSVNHALGKYPAVSTFTDAGEEIVGVVEHTDDDNLVITFAVAVDGVAYCN